MNVRLLPTEYSHYLAGSDGCVYSLYKGEPRKLTPWLSKGYPLVKIYEPGIKCKSVPVHLIIIGAFIGSRPGPNLQARHKDGNPQNNLPENLEWGTISQNNLDKRRHGTSVSVRGEDSGLSKLTEDEVREIRARYKAGGWTQQRLADVFNVHIMTVNCVINRRNWAWLEDAA